MNLPNKLSLFRIALVPLIAAIYILPRMTDLLQQRVLIASFSLPLSDLLVLALFAIASFTDYLDGSIARRRQLITSFGKFIDPIADKMLVNTLLILFAWNARINVVAVLLMIARDIIVDGLRMNAASSGKVVAAGYAGKVKTVVQMLLIVFVLLHDLPFCLFHIAISEYLLWIATAVSLYSGYRYFMELKDTILETM